MSQPVHSPRPKVFGIGLEETGTSSLHEALELLGYKSLHSEDVQIMGSVFRAIDEGRPLLHYLDPELDAFLGIPAIRFHFYLADVQYPGSRFILTVREAESVEHDTVVRAFFADRPGDLLVFDPIGGDGWEPLCEFLGQPVPGAPFPCEMRSPQSMAEPGHVATE
jgi:Sulfotransferase domain